jgi:hypothetical protein
LNLAFYSDREKQTKQNWVGERVESDLKIRVQWFAAGQKNLNTRGIPYTPGIGWRNFRFLTKLPLVTEKAVLIKEMNCD